MTFMTASEAGGTQDVVVPRKSRRYDSCHLLVVQRPVNNIGSVMSFQNNLSLS